MASKLNQIPILFLLCFNIILGLFTFQSYGTSIDEPGIFILGERSLLSYKTLTALKPKSLTDSPFNLIYYGPAFAMFTNIVTHGARMIFPSLLPNDIWHLCYFVCFLTAVYLLYLLALRWFSTQTAFAISLLFSSQPLLWGHAFINPKDIPFMTFFLASIVSGMYFLDTFFGREDTLLSRKVAKAFLHQQLIRWQEAPQNKKRSVLLISIIYFTAIVGVLVLAPIINDWIESFITHLFSAPPNTLFNKLFTSLAQAKETVGVGKYIFKGQTLTWKLLRFIGALSFLWVCWRWMAVFGADSRKIWKYVSEPLRSLPTAFSRPPLWLAAIFLGLATSIRIGAPYAALIIAILAIAKAGKKAIAPLCAYFLLAGLFTYLSWPALWDNPINHFIKSAQIAAHFPWNGNVFFAGNYFKADSLPWFYLPLLFSIQFTEPLVLLSFLGFVLMIRHSRNLKSPEWLILTSGWLFIPLLYFILVRPILYDNFRQILFLLPPVFLLTGIPLQALFEKFHHPLLKFALYVVLFVPGAIGYIQLHPYEYTYYNSFIGGIQGASQRFETDYWKTSYRQAMAYLNKTAEPNRIILIWGNANLVSEYARPDFTLISKRGRSLVNLRGNYDYVIVSSRNEKDDTVYPDAPVIYTVERKGVIFAVVKKLPSIPQP